MWRALIAAGLLEPQLRSTVESSVLATGETSADFAKVEARLKALEAKIHADTAKLAQGTAASFAETGSSPPGLSKAEVTQKALKKDASASGQVSHVGGTASLDAHALQETKAAFACWPWPARLCSLAETAVNASFAAKPGDWIDGHVTPPEQLFMSDVKNAMADLGVEIYYVLDGPTYLRDHAMPLLHALPGTLVTLSNSGTQGKARDNLPVSLQWGLRHFADWGDLLEEVRESPTRLAVTWTCWGGRDNAHQVVSLDPQVVTLSHGDDEDMQWPAYVNGLDPEKLTGRPFQDLAFSRYLTEHRYKEPESVRNMLDGKLDQAFAAAPCQPNCRGTVLVSVPASSERTELSSRAKASCHLPPAAWEPLVKDWKLIVTYHPLCALPANDEGSRLSGWHEDGRTLPRGVFQDDPRDELSLQDLIASADAVVTSSAGTLAMITASRSWDDKAVVRIVPSMEAYQSIQGEVFNASMGVIASQYDGQLAGLVQEATKQVKEDPQSVKAARKDYALRYLWELDGFEEYRTALQLVKLAAKGVGHDGTGEHCEACGKHGRAKTLEQMAAEQTKVSFDWSGLEQKLAAFTTVGPRPRALYGASNDFLDPDSNPDMQLKARSRANTIADLLNV